MEAEQAHYQREKRYWDKRGQHDYTPLSAVDRGRILDWIGWQGHGRILDLGGGAGMVSRLLNAQPATQVVCVDISAQMLHHAPVPAIQADALELPVASTSIDLVVAAALLHHLPRREQLVLREAHRVLRPGGRLVGYDPSGWSWQNKLFMSGGPLRLKRFTPDERPIVPTTIKAAALESSFSTLEFESFTFRNDSRTAFELVQTYVINPLARGPLRKRLDRWFLWQATK